MTDPRPLAERVREIARVLDTRADDAKKCGLRYASQQYQTDALTLHEAADALALISEYRVAEIHLEARKDQP